MSKYITISGTTYEDLREEAIGGIMDESDVTFHDDGDVTIALANSIYERLEKMSAGQSMDDVLQELLARVRGEIQ